jgi:hypothetical protein
MLGWTGVNIVWVLLLCFHLLARGVYRVPLYCEWPLRVWDSLSVLVLASI